MYVNYICTKISKTIGILYKTRFLVPGKSLLLLHYSFASCHSLHPLELLPLFSLFLSFLYFFSFQSLSWFLWSCSRSKSRCSLSRILLFIWTFALASPCSNARLLLFVDSNDSTFQGLMGRQCKQSWSLSVRWEDFGRKETSCRRIDSSVVWPDNLKKRNKIR